MKNLRAINLAAAQRIKAVSLTQKESKRIGLRNRQWFPYSPIHFQLGAPTVAKTMHIQVSRKPRTFSPKELTVSKRISSFR